MKIRGLDAKITQAICDNFTHNLRLAEEHNNAPHPTIVKVDGERYGGQHVLVKSVQFYTSNNGVLLGAIDGELVSIASVATVDCG